MGCTSCESITLFKGETGAAASVAVGSVTTLSPGASATVTNTGSSSEATFNFGIPQGATGATGSAGAEGARGAQGMAGGWSSIWKYNTTTTANPPSNYFRFNHATAASVTTLFINDVDNTDANMQAFLDAFDNSGNFGLIKVTKKTDASVFWMGKVTSETDSGAYHTVAVTYVANNGAFTNEDECVISFVDSGTDKAAPYTKYYTARITQSGSGDPSATVPTGVRAASDYLGDIVWTRSSTGVYVGTLAGAFTQPVICSITQGTDGPVAAAFIQLSRTAASDNTVTLKTFNASGVATDALLGNANIEIKKYA